MIPKKKGDIVKFPTNGWETVKMAVEIFLYTAQEGLRYYMIQTIKDEMDRRGLVHLHCGSFEVFKKGDMVLFDTGNFVIGDCCPKCGQDFMDSKILTVWEGVDHERHVYGCAGPGGCGEVYTITWRKGDIYDIP